MNEIARPDSGVVRCAAKVKKQIRRNLFETDKQIVTELTLPTDHTHSRIGPQQVVVGGDLPRAHKFHPLHTREPGASRRHQVGIELGAKTGEKTSVSQLHRTIPASRSADRPAPRGARPVGAIMSGLPMPGDALSTRIEVAKGMAGAAKMEIRTQVHGREVGLQAGLRLCDSVEQTQRHA